MDFFSPVVTKIYKIFVFSKFKQCGLNFHQIILKTAEMMVLCTWNQNLLKFLLYL